jgi:hyperosmotically inducible protein
MYGFTYDWYGYSATCAFRRVLDRLFTLLHAGVRMAGLGAASIDACAPAIVCNQILRGSTMKTKMALTTLAFCAVFASAAVMAQKDSDTDRSHPGHFVKDSAITTKIKAKLAAEHITSMGRIHVDTDKNGVVWLSGTARSQAAIDQAVSIAENTEHVVSVKNHLKIRADD